MIDSCNTSSEIFFSAAPQHLTDDQLDEYLLGDTTCMAATHLRECTHCADRASKAFAPFADFNAASLEWSERRSATSPMPAFAAQPAVWQRRLVWACAMASFAVGLGLTNAARSLRPAQETATTAPGSRTSAHPAAYTATTAVHSASQIDNDNQMLSTIDRELEPAAETPAALGLEPVSARATRTQVSLLQD